MFAHLKSLCCIAALLTMALPAFSQTRDEIEELKSRINNPLAESKPSKEEAEAARKQLEASSRSRPKLTSLLRKKEIVDELELSGDQVEQIKELRKKRRGPIASSEKMLDVEQLAELMAGAMELNV